MTDSKRVWKQGLLNALKFMPDSRVEEISISRSIQKLSSLCGVATTGKDMRELDETGCISVVINFIKQMRNKLFLVQDP